MPWMKELKKTKDNTMIYIENNQLKIAISEKGAAVSYTHLDVYKR